MEYIDQFKEGQRVLGHYLCKERAILSTKAGKNYLSLVLQDKTGTISAKVWDITSQIGPFIKGDIIKIEGQVSSFQNDLQLNIQRLRRSEPGEYDLSDYSPTTQKNAGEMYRSVLDWTNQVQEPHLRALLYHFYRDNQELVQRIMEHPAAKSVHHNFVGGYLEHITSVTKLAAFLAGEYQPVNRDLVITAALLHDIGKLWELNPMPTGDYSTEGQLLGHIMIGYDQIRDGIREIPDFPPELALMLEHIILAHHGELEYGSPKVPMTMEALIIHLADNTDAKLKMVEEFMKSDPNEGAWTEYNRYMSRNFYKGGEA